MFTLGNKEAIVNSTSKFPVTVTAPTGTNSLLTIKGFGAFEDTHIVSAIAQRFIAGRVAGLTITSPDAAALGILAHEVNVSVIVHIRVNTSRHTSEWATDFIKRGRPFIFELLVDGNDTSTTIMNKLVAMFQKYGEMFNYSNNGLPFTWVQTGADVTLTLKSPYLSFQNFVDFLPRGLTYGIKADTTKYIDTGTTVTAGVVASVTIPVGSTAGLLVGDSVYADGETFIVQDIIDATSFTSASSVSITSGSALLLEELRQEPTFDGKYLEENVRLSNPTTKDSYGISPDESPIIIGSYTEITFTAWDDSTGGVNNIFKKHTFLGTTRGELGGRRQFTYTLYFLEGTDMFDPSGKVDTILQFLIDSGAPITIGIANGNTVTTVADFLTNTY